MDEVGCSDGKKKMAVAKSALKDFATLLPADANLGLVTFDIEGIKEQVPLAKDNRAAFQQKVVDTRAAGTTPLKDAITLAVKGLTEQARKQLGYGEYHLVIVTDGEAYPDDQNPGFIVSEILKGSPIIIHTVGFCIDSTHSLNQPGKTIYTAANNPQDVAQGLKSVLAESEKFNVDEFK
jgi:uncharacterized protein YegL